MISTRGTGKGALIFALALALSLGLTQKLRANPRVELFPCILITRMETCDSVTDFTNVHVCVLKVWVWKPFRYLLFVISYKYSFFLHFFPLFISFLLFLFIWRILSICIYMDYILLYYYILYFFSSVYKDTSAARTRARERGFSFHITRPLSVTWELCVSCQYYNKGVLRLIWSSSTDWAHI